MFNNSGSSRMDTLLKIVLIFVMSVLSFSIGAFVGKQVSDTEYRQAMLESEDSPTRATASVDPHSTDHTPDKALSEEDIASLTEEFVKVEKKALEDKHKDMPHAKGEEHAADANKDIHKVAKNEDGYKKLNKDKVDTHAGVDTHTDTPSSASHKEEHEKVDTHKKEHKASHQTSEAADRVSQNLAPTKDPAKKRKPTSVLPTTPASSVGKYTVQIASYATENEAKNHALKLKAKGYSAFYIPAEIRGQTWYRVSVGLFTNYKSAMAFRKELQTEADVKSSIIQKIVK